LNGIVVIDIYIMPQDVMMFINELLNYIK